MMVASNTLGRLLLTRLLAWVIQAIVACGQNPIEWTKKFKFDKLEVRRVTIAALLVACNGFYLFVVINNLMGMVMSRSLVS